MEIDFTGESPLQYAGDAVVIGAHKGAPLTGVAGEVNAALDGLLDRLIDCREITGKQSEVTVVHTGGKLPSPRVAVVGLGEIWQDPQFAIRRAAGAAARSLRNKGCRRVGMALHLQAPQSVRAEQVVRAVTEGAYTGLYRGEECKSEIELPGELEALALLGIAPDENDSAVAAGRAGGIAGDAANYARRLVNLPPNEMTPSRLAQEARRLPVRLATCRAVIHTGPVISSCGLIMAATLGSLMAGDLQLLRQLGFAFALGMLIDTFLVRPLLLPAFVAATGRTGKAPALGH